SRLVEIPMEIVVRRFFLPLLLIVSIAFAAFENCPNQESFDTCAENEIDRIMANTTVVESRELKQSEYHSAMELCWKKHCLVRVDPRTGTPAAA
ncbi:hypothetical protein PFISCL1PPCAC_24791, partial [Pristionchus fissidentatus]